MAPPVAVLDDETLAQLEAECAGSVTDLLLLFLSECDKRVARLKLHGRQPGLDVAREAHTLKGAAVSFGCVALSAAAADLEAAVAPGSKPAILDGLVGNIEQALRAARDALTGRYPALADAAKPT
jgi:HPt (histidine-containing phosphotransfer) domain-containing protein